MRSLARALAILATSAAFSGCNCEGSGIHGLFPKLRFVPASVDFGEVLVGTTKTATVQLANEGDGVAALSAYALASPQSPFSVTGGSTKPLAPKQAIVVSAAFTPTQVGRADNTLEVILSDHQIGQSMMITGVGVEAGVGVKIDGDQCPNMAHSIAFGPVPVMQTRDRDVEIDSTGNSPLTITGASFDPPSTVYSLLADPAGTQISPGGKAIIHVRYQPNDGSVTNGDTSTLVVSFAEIPQPVRVPLCGSGVIWALCAHPVPLDLGTVVVGHFASGTLNVDNCGLQPVTITRVSTSADPSHPTSPGFSIAALTQLQMLTPGQSLPVSVSFSATAPPGIANGFTEVDYGPSSGGPAFFPIKASVVEDCVVLVIPQEIDYYAVAPGSQVDRHVLVSNEGPVPCTVLSTTISQGASVFSVVTPPTLPDRLATGDSVELTVRYAPIAAGNLDRGALSIVAGSVPQTVQLVGNAPVGAGCHLDVTPSYLNFGVVPMNTTKQETARITNVGHDPCSIMQTVVIGGSTPGFYVSSQNAGTLGPGQFTDMVVVLDPMLGGPQQGFARVISNDAVHPWLDVPLSGQVIAPGICVDPTHLTFNGSPEDIPFTITACGARPVTVSDLMWTRPDARFQLVSPPMLPFTLQPGDMQLVTVRYMANNTSSALAVITVDSNDPIYPAIDVSMQGGTVPIPPTAGQYLYYWETESIGQGNIMRYPLQMMGAMGTSYWGAANGHGCPGCHSISPDGRYVAFTSQRTDPTQTTAFKVEVLDTTTNLEVTLPFTSNQTTEIGWRPNVNTNPPYQFVYDDDGQIMIGSVSQMIGPLPGVAAPNMIDKMPTWGANGKIAFVRGTQAQCLDQATCIGLIGVAEIQIVDENGGTPQPLNGASQNGRLNYYPAFSPNGQWIAFTQSRGPRQIGSNQGTYAAPDAQILLAHTDQSGAITLPALNGGTGPNSYPTWSVDGSLISFSSKRSGGMGGWDIWFSPIDQVTGVADVALNLTPANNQYFQHIARWSP
jgi:hypothetical protein